MKKLSLIILIILAVGVAIPKITINNSDAVTQSEISKGEDCIVAMTRNFERRTLLSLGDYAVVKIGDKSYLRTYTIFRIPTGVFELNQSCSRLN